jgi:hypothetical protein
MKKLCHTGAPTEMSVGRSTELLKVIRTVWEYVVHSIQGSWDEADKETCYDKNKRKFVPLLNEVQCCERTYGIKAKFQTHSYPQRKSGLRNQFHSFGHAKPREKALGTKRTKEWEGLSIGLDALFLSVIEL